MGHVRGKMLLSVNELAEELGEKPWTIRRWAKKGVIPSRRLTNRCTRFYPEAVRKALLGQGDSQAIGGDVHETR